MKTPRHETRSTRRSSGQAMVETVIVLPVFIFFILGTIQLTLMHQASIMLEYAAFNAARSGAVHNGDVIRMQRAALMSLIASRPSWPKTGGTALAVGPITDWRSMITQGLKVAAEGEIAGRLGVNLVQVEVLSPKASDFGSKDLELDFDSSSDKFSERRLGQLTIRVKYYFRLSIPFVNSIIWNTWWASRSPDLLSLTNSRIRSVRRLVANDSAFLALDTMDLNLVGKALGAEADEDGHVFGLNSTDIDFLFINSLLKEYYMPMMTTHTIRMQSNTFKCAIEGSCTGAASSSSSGS